MWRKSWSSLTRQKLTCRTRQNKSVLTRDKLSLSWQRRRAYYPKLFRTGTNSKVCIRRVLEISSSKFQATELQIVILYKFTETKKATAFVAERGWEKVWTERHVRLLQRCSDKTDKRRNRPAKSFITFFVRVRHYIRLHLIYEVFFGNPLIWFCL